MKPATRLIRTTLAAAIVMAIGASSLAAAKSVKLAQPWQSTGLVFDADQKGVQRVTTPTVDHAKLINEDIDTWRPGQPLRFAQSFETRLTPKTHGTWSEQADGSWLWQLRVASPKAESINLGFTGYRMPEGGELRIRSLTGKTVLRPFTAADNQAHGQLWTPIVPGDDLMVEVQVPAARREQLALELGAINHAYIEFGKAPSYLKSGACNVDVVCPEGDDWRDQIRSVAVYSRGGSTLCTGALVNNVEQDLKGYFLTANHCGMTVGNAPSMVVYWNFENSTCRTPGSGASGGNGDGQLNEFSTGATFRAARSNSDFALVEINNPIPSAYNVYWAGWDARPGDFPAVIAIHHPNTDEKRISFENDPTTTTTYLSDVVDANATHIRVADWDLGTTEPGSSGSPLYSPDGHIIGQLHGGYAACGNNDDDWYGRVSRSWLDGGTAATQLRNWLDPNNTGALVLDGRNEIEGPFRLEVEPALRSICRSDGSTTFAVAVLLEDVFNEPVTLDLIGEPVGASVAFDVNPVTGGGSSTATLGNLAALAGGVYPLNFIATSPGEPDAERAAELRLFEAAPAQAVLSSPANGATVSSPITLSWAADAGADAFRVEVSTTADFNDLVVDTVVGGNSHVLPNVLNPATTYFWRVRADNTCGLGSYSEARSFTTTDEICSAPNLAIPDNTPAGVNDQIVIAEGGELEDLDVSVEITHTWVGDLIVRLTHVESSTSIDLIDRPGRTTSGAGCNGDDINALLDDAAAAPVETQCAGSIPTISGTFSPNQPLSTFNGESLAGTWRLNVSDNAGADLGSLQRWCLLPSIEVPTFQAVDDSYSLDQDASLSVPAPGVLENDIGINLSVSGLVSNVDNGSLTLDPDGALNYTPDAGYCGPDGFVYEVTDGLEVDQAAVSIAVLCDASPPQVDDQAFSIAENSANDTLVGTIVAIDPNANPGDTLSYAVTGGSGGAAFTVHPSTGAIRVSNSSLLDYETTPSFSLLVTVTDNTSLSDSATISIELIDVAEAPTVPEQYFAVDENSPIGMVVGTVNATDPEGGPFTFAITGGSGAAAFAIAAGSGELSVANPALLDFETNPSLSVTVSATDSTELSGSGTIAINLNDVNETPVVADQGLALDENSAAGTVVGTIAASDPDSGDTLSFAVVGGTGASVFAVDASTGQITVLNSAALDYETTPTFSLGVTVEDAGGLSATATITISLNDVNEAPVGDTLADQLGSEGVAFAFDAATAFSDPDGDTLSFSVVGLPDSLSIDASTGVISGVPVLGDAGNYAVIVTANDGELSAEVAFALQIGEVGEAIFSHGFED